MPDFFFCIVSGERGFNQREVMEEGDLKCHNSLIISERWRGLFFFARLRKQEKSCCVVESIIEWIFNYVTLCGSQSAICSHLNESTEICLPVIIPLKIRYVEMRVVNSRVSVNICICTCLCVCVTHTVCVGGYICVYVYVHCDKNTGFIGDVSVGCRKHRQESYQ